MLEIICIHISDIRTESIGYQDITTALLLFHDRALECLYTVLRGVLEGLSWEILARLAKYSGLVVDWSVHMGYI